MSNYDHGNVMRLAYQLLKTMCLSCYKKGLLGHIDARVDRPFAKRVKGAKL
jgi:hypothetical protein